MEHIDHLLTPQHVADILGLPVGAIRMRIKRRQIPSVKMGRRNMVPESLLRTYINSLQMTADLTVSDPDKESQQLHLVRQMTKTASAAIQHGFQFWHDPAALEHRQDEFIVELDSAIQAMELLRQYLWKKL